jgi:hypothetical protein
MVHRDIEPENILLAQGKNGCIAKVADWRGMPAADLGGRTAFTAEAYEGRATQHLNSRRAKPGSLRPDLAAGQGMRWWLCFWLRSRTIAQTILPKCFGCWMPSDTLSPDAETDSFRAALSFLASCVSSSRFRGGS